MIDIHSFRAHQNEEIDQTMKIHHWNESPNTWYICIVLLTFDIVMKFILMKLYKNCEFSSLPEKCISIEI